MKRQNGPHTHQTASGDSPTSPEVESPVSGPDSRPEQPARDRFAERQEAMLLAVFRMMLPGERLKLLLRLARGPKMIRKRKGGTEP